jgi:hypothetical protein
MNLKSNAIIDDPLINVLHVIKLFIWDLSVLWELRFNVHQIIYITSHLRQMRILLSPCLSIHPLNSIILIIHNL